MAHYSFSLPGPNPTATVPPLFSSLFSISRTKQNTLLFLSLSLWLPTLFQNPTKATSVSSLPWSFLTLPQWLYVIYPQNRSSFWNHTHPSLFLSSQMERQKREWFHSFHSKVTEHRAWSCFKLKTTSPTSLYLQATHTTAHPTIRISLSLSPHSHHFTQPTKIPSLPHIPRFKFISFFYLPTWVFILPSQMEKMIALYKLEARGIV